MSLPLAMFWNIGPPELMLFGFVALLLFGKRLPEVARSLGKGVTEFKKGIHGLEEEIEEPSYHRELPHSADKQTPQAPKFEPPSESPATISSGDQDPAESVEEAEQKGNVVSD